MAEWLKDAVFYEIYPQSFKDTNGDGIGDFEGIISELDYIKDLGCNALWLNPCFDSPFTDAGYDVRDYYMAAPRYGTNEDLKRLFEECHKRDMHLLLDLVPGHTSYDHKWFLESMKAEENEYTNRYVWTDSVWDSPDDPNIRGWIRGISDRDGSCAVNFFSTQPALNYGFLNRTEDWQFSMDSPEATATREAMQDVMAFWLDMGCDGFRVDMAGHMVKGDDEESSGTVEFWKRVRTFLDEKYPDAVMISEWGQPDKALLGGFHMDFLLHFGPSHYMDLFRENPYFSREGTGSIKAFADRYMECYKLGGEKGMICIPSGNHDMDRMRKFLDEEEMKVAFAFLLSVPGAPFIYYGDEIGMRFVDGLTSVEGGFYRTGSRTPMQWGGGVNDGFSAARKEDLYIAMDESEGHPTVKNQMADENSLYHEVKKLIQIRKENKALGNEGKIEFLYAEENAYPFVYLRSFGDEKVLVALNPSGKDVEIELSGYEAKETIYSYGEGAILSDGKLAVKAGSAAFIRVA